MRRSQLEHAIRAATQILAADKIIIIGSQAILGSYFHQTHGFYIQGVGSCTAILPGGWADRLVAVSNRNTMGRTGLCLDPHDLCVAKLAANRPKDHEFVGALIDAGLIQVSTLRERLAMIETRTPERLASVAAGEAWLRSFD